MPEIKQDIRSRTFVVAADDSLHKNDADYVCDGASDQVEINAALNALPAQGGSVMLLEGTYVIDDSITIPDNNITLRGQGRSTFIDGDGLATGEHAIVVSGVTAATIKKLAIQTEDGGGKVSHCIFIEDGANDFHIESVSIVESDSDGIHIEGTNIIDGHIHVCHVEGADEFGIAVSMDNGNLMARLHIVDCTITGCGNTGIMLWGGAGIGPTDYANISGNLAYSNGDNGIYVWDSDYDTITNNIIVGNTGWGIRVRDSEHDNLNNNICQLNGSDGIMMEASHECVIEGNICDGSIAAGAADGIQIDGTDNVVIGNHCHDNGRHGINVLATGLRCLVNGNTCQENKMHGIHVAAVECSIEGNYCNNNSQVVPATYHGIMLTGTADRCHVCGNHLNDDGTNQEDGVHLASGAVKCQINDNYCYSGMGSGICLAGGNVDCQVNSNHCYDNDDYGIEILDESDRIVVTGNKCVENGNHGILISESDYCSVTGGVCNNNGGDGIHVAGTATHNADYNTLTGNVCTGNTGDGIEISEAGAGQANKNIVTSCQLLGNAAALTDGGTNTEAGHNITV